MSEIRSVKPISYAPLFVTWEHYERLVENVINDAQPVVQQSCDWFGCMTPQLYPLAVYRKLEEMRNGDKV